MHSYLGENWTSLSGTYQSQDWTVRACPLWSKFRTWYLLRWSPLSSHRLALGACVYFTAHQPLDSKLGRALVKRGRIGWVKRRYGQASFSVQYIVEHACWGVARGRLPLGVHWAQFLSFAVCVAAPIRNPFCYCFTRFRIKQTSFWSVNNVFHHNWQSNTLSVFCDSFLNFEIVLVMM